ncbi:ABC transporter permease [Spartinivicinus ruber]|uniref:ABC transporter permease n=1 Tax=Spartinivicinus ruber TaxID=2683272 RepID=UPI0013D3360C|nr:FtsX-like permease family protein [Spartinivicinus ruber]
MASLISLVWRLLGREWRSGELRVIMLALLVAVTATTAIGFFVDRLERTMYRQSAELLGGDLLIRRSSSAPSKWVNQAEQLNLAQTEMIEFPSVVVFKEQMVLTAVKAVESPYPLVGWLTTGASFGETEGTKVKFSPEPGEVWLERRLFHQLKLQLGDTIELGATELKVTRVLLYESDRGGDFYTLAPRALMNKGDLAAAEIIQPGSRVRYKWLVSGDDIQVNQLLKWLQPRLAATDRLTTLKEGRPALHKAINRAQRYLGLATLMAVLLAGVAIAIGAKHFATRHFDQVAIMRCLGGQSPLIGKLYLGQLLVLALIVSVVGCVAGFILHWLFVILMAELLPANLPLPGLWPAYLGLLTGVVAILGFALPPIISLQQVSALRVFRRELVPPPLSSYLIYGVAFTALSVLLWQFTGEWWMTLGLLIAVAGVGLVVWFGLQWGVKTVFARIQLLQWPLAVRLSLNHLQRQAGLTATQLLAFGLTLLAMTVILVVRTDLLTQWQRELPPKTPNYFAINIPLADQQLVADWFEGHQVEITQLYPIIRGRLTAINSKPVKQAVSKEQQTDNALNRELNLTWRDELPPRNELVDGLWWAKDKVSQEVSIEHELAKRLNIKLGDQLTFTIAGQNLEATVTSLREVNWESFQPNFYMIFPKPVLEPFAATYLTSFHLPADKQRLLAELVKEFPAITLLDVAAMLNQVRLILTQVTSAIEYVLLFVFAAGLAVLYAAIKGTLADRIQEGGVMRALGASRQQIRQCQFIEFAALGGVAGLLAALGTEIVCRLLYSERFDLTYQTNVWLWLGLPVLGSSVIAVIGLWSSRRVITESPMVVLRES